MIQSIRPLQRRARGRRILAVTALALVYLAGCGGAERESSYPDSIGRHPVYSDQLPDSVFGPGGATIFGGTQAQPGAGVAIPVNSFLWRATLDTLSFMPLASADPFGGVIISDWFAPPESTNERFKMTVYILSRELRSDGLRVAIFRQQRDASGIWVDSEVSPDTASELENAILTRARELRVASLVQ